jgi:hypothetical protein
MTDHIVEANKKVIDLDALEKLADEATPGPWTLKTGQTSYPECDDADSWSAVLTPRGREVVTLYERYGIKGEDRSDYDDDAAFIAAANPATIKALIAELREARGLLKSWVASAEAEYVEGLFYDDVKETRAFLSKAQGGE